MRTPPHTRVARQAGAPGRMKTCLRYRSNAKPRPPFGAACPYHRATAARFHADPKTVRTLAPGSRWLIGAFHDFCLCRCEKPVITTVNGCSCQCDLLAARFFTAAAEGCG